MHLQQTFENVTLPEELGKTTILVIGLMEMGYTDIPWMAKLLHLQETRSLRRLMRMLKTSKNPVVRRCVDVGLPPGVCRPFPYEGTKVRCPLCRAMIDHAPCPWCSLKFSRAAPVAPEGDDPLDATATTAVPGTYSKLAVMRRRVAAGVSAFHPDDGPVEVCP